MIDDEDIIISNMLKTHTLQFKNRSNFTKMFYLDTNRMFQCALILQKIGTNI